MAVLLPEPQACQHSETLNWPEYLPLGCVGSDSGCGQTLKSHWVWCGQVPRWNCVHRHQALQAMTRQPSIDVFRSGHIASKIVSQSSSWSDTEIAAVGYNPASLPILSPPPSESR
eukprot:127005-Rhodomonas_salina.1